MDRRVKGIRVLWKHAQEERFCLLIEFYQVYFCALAKISDTTHMSVDVYV